MTIAAGERRIERFDSVGDYASYCRMVESVRLSNGKKKGHGNRKCGNRYLCLGVRGSGQLRRALSTR